MEIMKFSRQTISRLAAGMSVQPATLVVAAQRLGVDLVGMIG
jgi:DNA-binding MurR/RpiR family transcriptional regulator